MNHISALASDLQDVRRDTLYRQSLLALLSDAEELLTTQPNDTTRIREIAFGMFRLVTDSWELERGAIGKRLMTLSGELRAYVAAVENNER